jgi:hypothetical protein
MSAAILATPKRFERSSRRRDNQLAKYGERSEEQRRLRSRDCSQEADSEESCNIKKTAKEVACQSCNKKKTVKEDGKKIKFILYPSCNMDAGMVAIGVTSITAFVVMGVTMCLTTPSSTVNTMASQPRPLSIYGIPQPDTSRYFTYRTVTLATIKKVYT